MYVIIITKAEMKETIAKNDLILIDSIIEERTDNK